MSFPFAWNDFADQPHNVAPRRARFRHHLKAAGIGQTLVRIPSWERGDLLRYETFIRLLRREGVDVVAALLQRRDDVLDPASWTGFLADVFSGFSTLCSHFEGGP